MVAVRQPRLGLGRRGAGLRAHGGLSRRWQGARLRRAARRLRGARPQPALRCLVRRCRGAGHSPQPGLQRRRPGGDRQGSGDDRAWPPHEHRALLSEAGDAADESRGRHRSRGAQAHVRRPALHRRRLRTGRSDPRGKRCARGCRVRRRRRLTAASRTVRRRRARSAAGARHSSTARAARRRRELPRPHQRARAMAGQGARRIVQRAGARPPPRRAGGALPGDRWRLPQPAFGAARRLSADATGAGDAGHPAAPHSPTR